MGSRLGNQHLQMHVSLVPSLFRGVKLIWMRVGQGPTALAVGAGGGGLDIFL